MLADTQYLICDVPIRRVKDQRHQLVTLQQPVREVKQIVAFRCMIGGTGDPQRPGDRARAGDGFRQRRVLAMEIEHHQVGVTQS